MRDMLARWIYDERGYIPKHMVFLSMVLVLVALLIDDVLGNPLARWLSQLVTMMAR